MSNMENLRLGSLAKADQLQFLNKLDSVNMRRDSPNVFSHLRMSNIARLRASIESPDPRTAHDWDYPTDFVALGSGYDVFGVYANSGAVTLPIFNWRYSTEVKRAGDHEIPSIVAYSPIGKTYYKDHFGSTAYELQQSLSANFQTSAHYKTFFSGTLSAGFNMTDLTKSDRHFGMVQLLCAIGSYRFDPNSQSAHDLLDEDFSYALKHYPPIELFKSYGTHFLSEVVMGARLDFCTVTRTLEYKSNKSIEASTEAAFKSLICGGSGSLNVEDSVALSEFLSATSKRLLSSGGAPEKAAMLGPGTSTSMPVDRYNDWINSVPSSQVFIDFASPDSLRGIWTLCSDAQRRTLLKDAAADYLQERDLKKRIYTDCIVDVTVIAGSSPNIQSPGGYEKLNYDLNKGAGGDYVYLCVRKEPGRLVTDSNKRPISEVAIVSGESDALVPSGFQKIPVDLNKGAGGKYIYLCKKYGDPGDIKHALSDIAIIGGEHANVAPPYHYKKIEKDLNQEAGGQFIFLCYR